jgi:hypothetical protein
MRIRDRWPAATLATILVLADFVPGSLALYVALTVVAASAGGLVIGHKLAIYVAIATAFLVVTSTLAAALILFRPDPHSHPHTLLWVSFAFAPPIASGATSALGVWCRRYVAGSPISN